MVSSGTDTKSMFYGARTLNQNVSSWETIKVTYFEYMFDGEPSFDTKNNTPQGDHE